MASCENTIVRFSQPARLFEPMMSVSLFFLVVLASCAQKPFIDPYGLVLGIWETDKGIVMSVEKTPDGTVQATVKLAPGYGGEDVKVGKVIISGIKPEPSGGYSGVFAMPGGLKPVSVEISLLRRNTMLILSRDRRVKGNRMIWKRVRGKPDGQPK